MTLNLSAAKPGGISADDGVRRQGFVPLPALLLMALLTGCAHKEPKRTQTTAVLTGKLQDAAVRTDQAQTASKAVGEHLGRMELSRVDGKAEVIKSWLRGQP